MTAMAASFQSLQKSFADLLSKSYKNADISAFKTKCQALGGSDADKKAALDQSFRDVLVNLLRGGDLQLAEKIISFSVLACRSDMVTTTMPVVLLGDIFDAVTLDQSEEIFSYVEKNVRVWKEDLFFAACKNNLLRMCNDLLRRLSRSQNTVFCGKILLFLAKFFPFSERSGLNIVSEFNLDNLTEYGSDGKEMGEGTPTETTDENPLLIDYNLYCKFWALQDFFRNPNQCYNVVQWKTFSTYAGNVLAAFKSFKLEDHRNRKKDPELEALPMETDLQESQNFFAKFLTNPKLLSLQLSDSNFRRSVLVQFLILFQYLTSQVKFKAESLSLTAAQADWIKETEELVFRLLEETPPKGKKFCASVKRLLEREEMWNKWKNDGCKEFKKPEVMETEEIPPKRRSLLGKRPKKLLGDLIRDATKQNRYFMGNAELTKLWNLCPDNLGACKAADRNFLPNVETYLESKEKNEPAFEWRALRLLARQSPHFFTLVTTSSMSTSDSLEEVRKKILKEKQDGATIKQEAVEEEEVELNQTEVMEPEEALEEAEPTTAPITNKHSEEQLSEICPAIGEDWKKLAEKLGFNANDLKYFETEAVENKDDKLLSACKAMLNSWFDEDEDACWDSLAYTLEGLKMEKAANLAKNAIPS